MSYSDYLAVVRGLNDIEMDSVSQKLVASVHLFYHDAGTAAPLKGSAKEVIGKYNRLLDGSLAKGIRTKHDAIDFLRKEDVLSARFFSIYQLEHWATYRLTILQRKRAR